MFKFPVQSCRKRRHGERKGKEAQWKQALQREGKEKETSKEAKTEDGLGAVGEGASKRRNLEPDRKGPGTDSHASTWHDWA